MIGARSVQPSLAVFESTLNPETRRSGGMHYTSIENIHKLIDPLFLDGLKAEFAEIEAITVERARKMKLEAFQRKLAGLKFLDFLPLKSYANITEGNALRIEWTDVIPNHQLNYVMGNPPFVGYSLQSKDQKSDILSIYTDEKGKPYKTAGKIDYVSGWYFKAAQLMQGTNIRTAFVSTNSITQGEQVASVWKPLYDCFGIHIDFAHRTFQWDSEASLKAHVHCVIVGFSVAANSQERRLFASERVQVVENINACLLDAPNVFIDSRSVAICNVPQMVYGSKPTDGGFLFLTAEERNALLKKEPATEKFIRQIYGATEYINNKVRYCLWLVGASPAELLKSAFIMERVEQVKQFRLSSTKAATQKVQTCQRYFRKYVTQIVSILLFHAILLKLAGTSHSALFPRIYLSITLSSSFLEDVFTTLGF